MASILLVEDDETIGEPLVRALGREGYDVRWVRAGREADDLADSIDLVVLDLTLPDVDGIEVCRRLRSRSSTLPIVMLTARADELDLVAGFDAGADDYVTKPFRFAELAARLRARLRLVASPNELTAHGVTLDLAAHRAFHRGHELDLTPKEFDLLSLLVREAGRVVPRHRIMREVWDEHYYGTTRTLDMHVSALRRKLGDDADRPVLITTVRGVGLRFEAS